MEIALWCVAAFCAYLVKGMSGFANTLVFSSILSFSQPSRSITPVDLLLGLPANLYLAWRERRSIQLKALLPLAVTLAIGILPGTLLLRGGQDGAIKILLGAAIVALAVELYLRQRQTQPKPTNRWVLLGIGLLSGFLCGLFGIGAFLVAYISRTTTGHSALRGTVCATFLVDNTIRLILYWRLGLLGLAVAWQALWLAPAMAAGLACGLLLSKKLPEKAVRNAVTALLLLMGLSIVITNAISLFAA